MTSFGERTRFATLLVAGAILIVAGISVRVISLDPLLLGELNDVLGASTQVSGSNAASVLQVAQTGTGSAVRATTGGGTGTAGSFSSTNGTGVIGISGNPDRAGVVAGNSGSTAGTGSAITADGGQNSALLATSGGGTAVVAASSGQGTAGIHALDRSPDGSGYALVATGDVSVVGSLSVSEACVGCSPMVLAANGSSVSIEQGEAVAIAGLHIAPDGSTVAIVRPAARYEQVFGVVDRGLVGASSRDVRSGIRPKWLEGETVVAAGGLLRVAIGGMLTLDAELPGVRAGARLWVGQTPGKLVTQHLGVVLVGRYLGVRPDGRGVILIDIDQRE
ncbi:MAG TPA: hypothetical protein VM408_00970 [Methylomirabilota bacterium]|nr:hypothetical protein [Methylomirabilota bacterium]